MKPKGFRNTESAKMRAKSSSVVFTTSPEPAGDVVFGQLLLRVGEYQIRRTDLHQIAHVKIGSTLRHPRRLLHIVSHDDNGVICPQFIDQILVLPARYRTQPP